MHMSYVAVDIETTGLSPVKDKIIEIGAVKVVNGKITGQFSELIDPAIKLSSRIVQLTGITDDMLYGKRFIEDVIPEFVEFAEELPLLGHNILFDYSFLKTAANKQGIVYERMGIDTLYISRVLHEDLESKSLGAMCSFYQIESEKKHRAYYDAQASMELYMHLGKHEKASSELLLPRPLNYRVPKQSPITAKQKNYLIDLMKYHKIEINQPIDHLTKSEASRMIDKIILTHGRM